MPKPDPKLGKSPFCTKGLVYLGAKEFYQNNIPGGLAAVYKGLADERLRAFFQQEFVDQFKYDILPLVPISAAAAAVAGTSPEDLVRSNARALAQRDINGIYSLFLRMSSPKMVATMLPKASLQYFSFGTAKGEMQGPTSLLAYQSGIPTDAAAWMMWAVQGFAPVALELAGAHLVTVLQQGNLVSEGSFQGYPVCKLTWRIQWA